MKTLRNIVSIPSVVLCGYLYSQQRASALDFTGLDQSNNNQALTSPELIPAADYGERDKIFLPTKSSHEDCFLSEGQTLELKLPRRNFGGMAIQCINTNTLKATKTEIAPGGLESIVYDLSKQIEKITQKVDLLYSENFSSTTKISGEENFILGGIPSYRQANGTANNATSFNYDLRFFLDTSYSGQDLLRIRLRSDNFNSLPFGSSNSNIFKLVKASDNDAGLRIDRFYYRFPLGKQWKLTIAAKMQTSDAYAFKPTAYDSQILDLFNLAGAAGLYNKTTGPGLSATWKQAVGKGKPYWIVAASFISGSKGTESDYGLFNQESALNGNIQIGLRTENWGVAMGFRRGTDGTRVADGNGTAGTTLGSGEYSNNIGISGYWQPLNKGWVPSISLGYGYTQNSTTDNNPPNSQSWALGLQWSDVLAAGNAAGIGIGQPANAIGEGKKAWLYELFYRWQLSDNISTTAAVFLGTNAAQTAEATNLGGVIQTQFRF